MFSDFLKYPNVFGPKATETHQTPRVFGHVTFQKFDSTTENEGQNAQPRQGSQFRAKMNTGADPLDTADPSHGLLSETYSVPPLTCPSQDDGSS